MRKRMLGRPRRWTSIGQVLRWRPSRYIRPRGPILKMDGRGTNTSMRRRWIAVWDLSEVAILVRGMWQTMDGLPHWRLSVHLLRNTSTDTRRVGTIELVNHYTLRCGRSPGPIISVRRVCLGRWPGERARELLNYFRIWGGDVDWRRRYSDSWPRGLPRRCWRRWCWLLSNFLPVTFMTLQLGRSRNRFEGIAILGQRSSCKCRMAPTNLIGGMLVIMAIR